MQNTAESNKSLQGKKIILGITGSISAYKGAYIASALVKRCADVHVVMTESAQKLIAPATFWSITSNPVITRMFDTPLDHKITHVSLPESADIMVIAPATANMIGKIANGIADDMLSTMAMVVKRPIIIAPAMNNNMYTNPIVVANIERLRQYENIIIDPEFGYLACGTEAVGRLADPDKIVSAIESVLIGGLRDLVGVKIVVTAGPTQEPIDPVRYLTNRSSGKMGYAIAEKAAKRGAFVTLISGPTDLQTPPGVNKVSVNTVKEMLDAVITNVKDAQLFISAAAPADFVPESVSQQKIKKTPHLTLELSKADDILATVSKQKGKMTIVGFAAETEHLLENAHTKLQAKKLDLIVANDVSPENEIFGGDTNEVTLISRNGDIIKWPRMSKSEVASEILDYVQKNLLEVSR